MSSQPAANGVEVSRAPARGFDAPPLWLLLGLTAMLAIKIGYVDHSTSWLRCTSTVERVCDAQSAANVAFAGGTRLRGYSVTPARLRPGEVLRVNLFWQADYPIKVGESSFLHLRNSQKDWPLNPRTNDEIWVQDRHDGPGGFFTTGYIPNRIYTEEYRVSIPVDMPPGTYLLETGWSDIGTGDQIEPVVDTVRPPLKVLWRSILLPSVIVQ